MLILVQPGSRGQSAVSGHVLVVNIYLQQETRCSTIWSTDVGHREHHIIQFHALAIVGQKAAPADGISNNLSLKNYQEGGQKAAAIRPLEEEPTMVGATVPVVLVAVEAESLTIV